MPRLSILMPVYNERAFVGEIIRRVIVQSVPGIESKELIIVDDGSTDGTGAILHELAKEYPAVIKLISHERNLGKTAAVCTAVDAVSGDICLIQDADLEYLPENYPNLLAPIISGQEQVVYGSRFKGHIRGMTMVNRAANLISNLTMRILYRADITDFHTAFKAFRAEILKSVNFTARHFSFDTEVTCYLLQSGYKIAEVPISYVARTIGKKITWALALETYGVLWRMWFMGHLKSWKACRGIPIKKIEKV